MIWAILALLGVPLWLCALAILALVLRNRGLRQRPGNLPVRFLRPGKTRWMRGHAVWVSDVFALRGSPAAWREELAHVTAVTVRDPQPTEQKMLRRLGNGAVVAALATVDDRTLLVATGAEHRASLPGPFSLRSDQPRPVPQPAAES